MQIRKMQRSFRSVQKTTTRQTKLRPGKWGVLLAAMLVFGGAANAATIYVDDNCGATPDGSSANPYCSLPPAITAASNGDTLQVAKGNYPVTSTIAVNKSLTINGPQADVDPRPAKGSARVAGNANEAVFDGGASVSTIIDLQANNITLNGLEFTNGTGKLVTATGTSGTPYIGLRVAYSIIHKSRGTGNNGIAFKYAKSALVEYNNAYDCKESPISVNTGSADAVIQYNEVHNSDPANGAIYVYDTTALTSINATIKGNIVHDITDNDGIKLGAKTGGTDATDSGGTIQDNVLYNLGQDGITVYTSNTTVQGNEVYASTTNNGAIYVSYSVDNVTIEDNYLHGNSYGITIGGAGTPTNVTVNDNRILANTVGVRVRSTGGYTLSDNDVVGNTTYGVQNDTTTPVNAQNNWWGDSNGPLHQTSWTDVGPTMVGPNASTGDEVTDYVRYKPNLTSSIVPEVDLNGSDTGNDFSATFTEGGGAVNATDTDATIADGDSANLEGATITLTNKPDGTDEALAATTTGTAITAAYNSGTGVLSLTGTDTIANYITVLRSVTYNNVSLSPNTADRTVTFKVTDGTNESNTATATISVVSTNDAPVATDGNAMTDEDTPIDIDLADLVSDDNTTDANLIYSIVDQPAGGQGSVSLNGSVATYTPAANFNGETFFTYKVTDEGTLDSNTAKVTINVSSVEDAPVLDPIGNKTIDELAPYSFQASASDGDNNTLTFSLQNQPTGASITSGGLFTWTPTEAQGPGSYTFKVRVFDGTSYDEEQITITVREVNAAPIMDLGSNRTVTGGVPFSFGIAASDPDIPAQSLGVYPIAPTPNWVGLTNGPTIYGTAPVSNSPYTVTITIRAGDNYGATTDKSIQLTVNPVPVTAAVTWTVTPTFNATEGTLTYRLKNTTNQAITGIWTSGLFRVQPKSVSSNIGTTSWNNQGNGYYGVYWYGFNVAPGQEKVLTVKVARPPSGRQVADTLYCSFGPNPGRTLATPGVNAP